MRGRRTRRRCGLWLLGLALLSLSMAVLIPATSAVSVAGAGRADGEGEGEGKGARKVHEALLRPRLLLGLGAASPFAPAALRDDDRLRVVVEVRRPSDLPRVQGIVEGLGGRVEVAVGAKLQAQLPREALKPLAERPEVLYIRPPLVPVVAQGAIVSEGVALTGADRWHEAGFKGQGVKVAVLDSGFIGYKRLARSPRVRTILSS